MDAITTLFTQYSFSSLVVLFVTILVAIKFGGDLWDWFSAKFLRLFDKKTKKQAEHDKLVETQENILQEIGEIKKAQRDFQEEALKKFETIEEDQRLTKKRLQENSRSYLIDAHHKYVYEIGSIDELALQSLERRFMYYTMSGGNSFIENLMTEVRQLPRVTAYTTLREQEGEG